MAPITQVKALPLPSVPGVLQHSMRLNRVKLEKAGLWEFLLWARDPEKTVIEDKVARFVATYNLKTHLAVVQGSYVSFQTNAIAKVTALPDSGDGIDDLLDLRPAEAELIFGPKHRWGKESMTDPSTGRGHWKAWLELVNSYLLFRAPSTRMEQKYVVAAVRSWEGIQVNWCKLVLTRMSDEIQERKAVGAQILHLYSAYYISCLCEKRAALPEESSPDTRSSPRSPGSPTPADLVVELGRHKCRIQELETTLSAKKDKLEQVQERSADFLQQINQMLQEKLSDQRKHEGLQNINAALKIELEDLQQELKRAQQEGPSSTRLEEANRELKRLQPLQG